MPGTKSSEFFAVVANTPQFSHEERHQHLKHNYILLRVVSKKGASAARYNAYVCASLSNGDIYRLHRARARDPKCGNLEC